MGYLARMQPLTFLPLAFTLKKKKNHRIFKGVSPWKRPTQGRDEDLHGLCSLQIRIKAMLVTQHEILLSIVISKKVVVTRKGHSTVICLTGVSVNRALRPAKCITVKNVRVYVTTTA